MKTNNKYYRWAAVLKFCTCMAMVLVLFSCEDFVQVDLPDSQLNSNDVFEDPLTARAAMANIFADLRDTSLLAGSNSGLSFQMGHYSDELQFYASTASASYDFYNNALMPATTQVANWWNASYNQIYAANAVIEGVQASQGLPDTDRQQLRGEALFVRALLHYHLALLYGDIPYITSTDYEQNRIASRLPLAQVYETAISDLEEAMQLLPEEYVGADRSRPNKYAVAAMLSKVQLEAGMWAEAADSASMVINATVLYSMGTPADEFLKASPATLWQFRPREEGSNTQEAQTFLFTSVPPTQYAVAQSLLDAFEANDLRKEAWLAALSDGTQTWYAVGKYRERNQTSSSVEHSIVLRLPEQYLIRAEARARQGELIGAVEDLNVIRMKAGLLDSEASTQQQIMDAILQEWRIEFLAEFGHRFFDLRRFGALDTALSPVKPGWDATDRLLPLPESEMLLNPNLEPQNPGY